MSAETARASLNTPGASPTLELLTLSLPIIAMAVSRMLMGFIDFVMVSQLGTAYQAAISPATAMVFAILSFGLGAAGSVQTFASQADGRGQPEQGSAYAWQSFYVAALLGLLIWPVTLGIPAFFEWLGELAGHDPLVRGLEADFVSIALWSMTPAVISAGLDGFFNGIQKPRIGLTAVVISLTFHVAANYVLIFGKLGFPAMGIEGSALATVLAWCVRAGVLLIVFCSPAFHARYHT
ncbi:MAG: MATE family efflux transporter, partial [Dongiaceae bacterium]